MSDTPSGLLVPLTTPFDSATGDVAPVHLRNNVRALLDRGVDGLVACGSTGEAALLDDGEYRDIVGWLRDIVPTDRWLIVGAGRESTKATIAACRAAADAGGDAVLVRAPAYYSPAMTPHALENHFMRVADDSPLPVLLYNMPKYTHVSFTDAMLMSLSDHTNIWGMKDSSGDLKNFAAYRDAVPNWTLFMGSGALYYAALELGAAGAIAATGCFAAELTAEVGLAFSAGDRKRAGTFQERVVPLHREIVGGLGIAGIKTAIDAVGLAGGPVRSPLCDLDERARTKVIALLRQAGLCTN
ncbi:MAG: dihydrodipicolinate synthase family protein [Gemmatimonadota bacterium]|nr:MAG: dihydrodipicolinate synthase family protein [Gemmatimonadota bacterium]